MAMVYKCDRCGKVTETAFDGGGNGPFVWSGIMSKDQENMDLCEDCYKSLIQWLERENKPEIKKGHCDDAHSCDNCEYQTYAEHMYPCNVCSKCYTDHWEKARGD